MYNKILRFSLLSVHSNNTVHNNSTFLSNNRGNVRCLMDWFTHNGIISFSAKATANHVSIHVVFFFVIPIWGWTDVIYVKFHFWIIMERDTNYISHIHNIQAKIFMFDRVRDVLLAIILVISFSESLHELTSLLLDNIYF